MRTRFQFGSLKLKNRKNGPKAWEFRYYADQGTGKRDRKTMTPGTIESLPSKAAARKAVEGLLLRLNGNTDRALLTVPTMNALIQRYNLEGLPERYSTRSSYVSMLKTHILPKWGDFPIGKIKAMEVERWFKGLSLAPKTKGHIRSMMHLVFQCAARWELISQEKNPIKLVRIKGCSKRQKRPRVLSVEEMASILPFLREPYRMMVLIALCFGFRASEIMGLQWGDFDFGNLSLTVRRAVVHGRVDKVKTEYSGEEVPLDPELATILLRLKQSSPFNQPSDWVFANPRTKKPYHQEEIQKSHIKPAAIKAGLGEGIGWHTFRHSYSSLLRQNGEDFKVQQSLLRHADIQTTMNVYTQANFDQKRKANSRVVKMVLGGADSQKQ